MKYLFILTCLYFTSAYSQNQSIPKIEYDIAPEWLAIIDASSDTTNDIRQESRYGEIAKAIVKILSSTHYSKKKLGKELSKEVFDRYLSVLDPQRLYFIESDIKYFEPHRYMVGDYLKLGEMGVFYAIFNVYRKRCFERLDYINRRLNSEFDFSTDEDIELDRGNSPWPINSEEMDEIWGKKLKNEALNLKLAGKDSESTMDLLKRRYDKIQKKISQSDREDLFQFIINAYTESYDPRTAYFGANSMNDFMNRKGQSSRNIGLELNSENEYIKVAAIIPGSSADRSEQIFPNDRIIGVGLGTDGKIVDVVGWSIDDVMQLIHGEESTFIRLEILPAFETPDVQPDTVTIFKSKIAQENQSVIQDTIRIVHENEEMNFGIIKIPSFYHGLSQEISEILKEFESRSTDGIIINLRGNQGGLLSEAVESAGLFIEKGPIVQIREREGRVEIRNPSLDKIYAGPLVVMIDRLSAGASEIFAAAIQDYNRGIIIGSKSSGSGAIQMVYDPNRFVEGIPEPKESGYLKVTVGRLYRITGTSLDPEGIMPDLFFPSLLDMSKLSEDSENNQLLTDQIEAANYKTEGELVRIIPHLKKLQAFRLANNSDYSKLLETLKMIIQNKEIKTISLQEEKRKEERKKKPIDIRFNNELLLAEIAHILTDYIFMSQH